MSCAICRLRKPKRECPGVNGIICTVCCGTEREQSIDCPLSCEYLRQAHLHEHPTEAPEVPNLDIEITDEFLDENEPLMMLMTVPLSKVVREKPAITDYDLREALASLVGTLKTLQSGILFEHRLTNPYAMAIVDALKEELEQLRQSLHDEDPEFTITDDQALRIFAFLQRSEYAWNNGRRKSRAFVDRVTTPAREAEKEAPMVAEPDEPRIIL